MYKTNSKRMFLNVLSVMVLLTVGIFLIDIHPTYAAWNVWLDHSIKKIKQDGKDSYNVDTKSGKQTIAVSMAKNEFESFQVFIYANGETLHNVDVTVSNFTKGSDKIDDIYLYKEHYINCSKQSRVEYNAGYYPDALLPKVDRYYHEIRNTFPFNVSSQKVQGVWVDVGTTKDTPAGTYTATVTISAQGKSNITIPVTVQVYDFALPSTAMYPARYVARADDIVKAHGFSTPHSPEGIEIVKQYNKMFLYHKMNSWMRGDGRSLKYNWNKNTKILTIQNWEPWESYHKDVMDGTAITSGPYAGAKFPILNAFRIEKIDRDDEIDNEDRQTAARQYYQQIYDHYENNGWDPMNKLYFNVIDEPNCKFYQEFRGKRMNMCEIAKAQAIDMNSINTHGKGTMKNVFVHVHRNTEGMTDWANYGFYAPGSQLLACRHWDRDCDESNPPPSQREQYPGYPNDKFWTNIGCPSNGCDKTGNEFFSGQMDSAVDAMPIYNRISSFVLWKYESKGTVYWQTTFHYNTDDHNTGDPFYDIWGFGSNGDGHYLYPGVATKNGRVISAIGAHTPAIGGIHDIPIESIRWKYLRDVQEDLEYMELAKESKGKSAVDEQVNKMFTNNDRKHAYYYLNKNLNDLFMARNNIAKLIDGNILTCSSSHLNLCTTQSTCTTANGNWCNNQCQSNSCTGGIVIRADVNQDNKITATDALLTLKKSVDYDLTKLVEIGWHTSTTTGDVNCDGEVSATDAMLILKKSVGGYSQEELEEMGWYDGD